MKVSLSLAALALALSACRTPDQNASAVKDAPAPAQSIAGLAMPSAEVLKGFETYCKKCHDQWFDETSGAANWGLLSADAQIIAQRLNWETANQDFRMPPFSAKPGSPYQKVLADEPTRKAMLKAVTATGPTAPPADLPLETLKMPPGFKISVFAKVDTARQIAISPSGTVFVGTGTDAGDKKRVFAMRDDNHDGVADKVFVIADNLNTPNGVAFKDGSLYVGEINRILRYDNIEANLATPPQPVVVTKDLPSDAHHGRKVLHFGPDGKLYVPVGSPCNSCDTEGNPQQKGKYGRIFRMNPDGSGKEEFAKGIRNTVGFGWHPVTKELWFTENGRDEIGNNEPPDELNRAEVPGLHFGFPFCNSMTPDPALGNLGNCNAIRAPAQKLHAHIAALGMTFYRGSMLPEAFHNQIIIAEHGSWNADPRVGYRLTTVTLSPEGDKALSYNENFINGWLRPDQSRWGRPVDVAEMPDGSLLVSDDMAGVLYRITYSAH